MERFSAAALPTSELELWRYSRIDELDLDRYRPCDPDAPLRAVPATVSDLVSSLGPHGTVIVTSNGRIASVTGGDPALAVSDGWTAADGEAALAVDDTLVELNSALAPSRVELRVSAGAALASPVIVVHWVDADAAVFPRTLVHLEPNAEALVTEVLMSGDSGALVVPVAELDLADGARLAYLHLQLLGPRVWQLGLQTSKVARDASLTSAAVALGGDYARLRTDSALVAPGGTSRLQAVFFAAGAQMHDFRTIQDHRSPRTTSDLLYKGAVANRARSVYSGLIRVAKGARGTNAYQTNRNLVLHEGAHADSVPNLEIEDNDVHCSHASTVGPIAEDERFYLESRGVPTETAERLIALGFLDDVLSRLPLPGAVDALRLRFAAKLDEAEHAEATLASAGERR
ncbi:MAG: SufB/SufD family protein [Acidimicrobiales bacterium]